MAIMVDGAYLTLHTKNTTYQMQVGRYKNLLHLYYGRRAEGNFHYLLTFYDRGFSGNPYDAGRDATYSLDVLPLEYPCYGNGDFRSTAFTMKDARGVFASDLRYQSHEILPGKYSIPGLPAVYDEENKAQTLKVVLQDEVTGVEVELYYGVIEDEDIITRAAHIVNRGKDPVTVERAFSGNLDLLSGDYDILHFQGRHGMERSLERIPVSHAQQTFGSIRGTSSHQQNPFLILADQGATEDYGNCYGMSLLYSGNFTCRVERDQYGLTRASMGIADDMFEYTLQEGEDFWTPELAMTCAQGLNALSWNYHRLVRRHIIRGDYKTKRCPVLLNNWEATYFNFTGEKIIRIAEQAAELGVEMLVLDDGWFGKRDSDDSGLGDWFVNEKKMGMPLPAIVEKINGMGMKFGLWIEPEMVSEDSDLYRTHPEWAYTIPGRKPVRGRNQLVLDFSRTEVVDAIFAQIEKVIASCNIEYIKMDMNRSVTDIYTATEGYQNQGRIMYDYVKGVYAFIEKLNVRFPHILIEGCSGGGGRFDMGMLYYVPQIWCSDNTDAVERLWIQHGTSFAYPVATMGAHVSAVPNHQTGRTTNITTRGVVAQAGTFGYELDLNQISEEEKEIVRCQIEEQKKYFPLIHDGRYYRLSDPAKHPLVCSWLFVSEDQKEALVSIITMHAQCNQPVSYVKLRGMKEDAVYQDEKTGEKYSGAALMYAGIQIPLVLDDYQALQYHFVMV
jgi:alpha-galactosidase